MAQIHVEEPIVHEDENLGEDFDRTPWIPPSIDRAIEYRKKHVFRGGMCAMKDVEVVNAPDLSITVSMYFQFMRQIDNGHQKYHILQYF